MILIRKIKNEIRKRLKEQKGFTLIELLVVMAILGVIGAGLAYMYLGDYTGSAQLTKSNDDLNKIQTAIQTYVTTTGKKFGTAAFPATNAGLNAALFNNYTSVDGTSHAALLGDSKWTAFGTDVNDPWERPYRFTTTAPYYFITDGPDMTSNTADDIKVRVQ